MVLLTNMNKYLEKIAGFSSNEKQAADSPKSKTRKEQDHVMHKGLIGGVVGGLSGHGLSKILNRHGINGIIARHLGAVGAYGGAVNGLRSGVHDVLQEKKAAMETLLNSGIDFDTAVDLIKQAEQDLYGKK